MQNHTFENPLEWLTQMQFWYWASKKWFKLSCFWKNFNIVLTTNNDSETLLMDYFRFSLNSSNEAQKLELQSKSDIVAGVKVIVFLRN